MGLEGWWLEGWWLGYATVIARYLRRVLDIRFSKCSGVGWLRLTQPLDIRHPWLRSRSRQRRVAELLGLCRTLRKSNIRHKSQIPGYRRGISYFYALPQAAHLSIMIIYHYAYLLENPIETNLLPIISIIELYSHTFQLQIFVYPILSSSRLPHSLIDTNN